MIVRFENLLSKENFTKNMTLETIEVMKERSLWSVEDTVCWINKIIQFDSHVNVLIYPLYAWECITKSSNRSIFDTAVVDENYTRKLTDDLCIKHVEAEIGLSNKSGKAAYLGIYKFTSMPVMKYGDVFVLDNISFIVSSFEIHQCLYGKPRRLNRVVVVVNAGTILDQNYTAVISGSYNNNPLSTFLEENGCG